MIWYIYCIFEDIELAVCRPRPGLLGIILQNSWILLYSFFYLEKGKSQREEETPFKEWETAASEEEASGRILKLRKSAYFSANIEAKPELFTLHEWTFDDLNLLFSGFIVYLNKACLALWNLLWNVWCMPIFPFTLSAKSRGNHKTSRGQAKCKKNGGIGVEKPD